LHTPCIIGLSIIVKSEGVLKITGSHVHFKSGSISKTVLDKDVEKTTVYKQEVIYGLFNSSNYEDLGCKSTSFIDCKLFQIEHFLFAILTSTSRGPYAIAERLVIQYRYVTDTDRQTRRQQIPH